MLILLSVMMKSRFLNMVSATIQRLSAGRER